MVPPQIPIVIGLVLVLYGMLLVLGAGAIRLLIAIEANTRRQ
jgi:hypothetical protein